MQRLRLIDSSTDVNGFVIEANCSSHGLPKFVLNHYFLNGYGEYDYTEYDSLDSKAYDDVISQKRLAQKVQRLHYYFQRALYISEDVIDILKEDYEDVDYDLQGVVIH